MKWFFLLLLTEMQGDLHEGFLWSDPIFDSQEECLTWVDNNPIRIIQTMNYYYTDWVVEQAVCVREDKLDTLKIRPYPEGTNI